MPVCSCGSVKPSLSGGIGPETVMTRGAISGPPARASVWRMRAAGASVLNGWAPMLASAEPERYSPLPRRGILGRPGRGPRGVPTSYGACPEAMATSKPDAVKTSGIWAPARGEVDAAAERLHLDEGMHRVLRMPKRELTVHFPLTHDDGR